MSRTTKACILLCGSLVARNPRPFASTRAPMPSPAAPASRPATPSLPHTVVTRPTPPLQRRFEGFHRHHHDGPAFVFSVYGTVYRRVQAEIRAGARTEIPERVLREAPAVFPK